MLKSKTAVKHGGGSLPYRWVSGLTATERKAVKGGKKVYFKIDKVHYTQSGYKVVTIWAGKYGFREPTPPELRQIKRK